jgi:hypothetical protein
MAWLGISALLVRGMIALALLILVVLASRQRAAESDLVEMPGGETIFDPVPIRVWNSG